MARCPTYYARSTATGYKVGAGLRSGAMGVANTTGTPILVPMQCTWDEHWGGVRVETLTEIVAIAGSIIFSVLVVGFLAFLAISVLALW